MAINKAKTLDSKKGYLRRAIHSLNDCLKTEAIDIVHVKKYLDIMIEKYKDLKSISNKLVELHRYNKNDEAAEAELNKMDEIENIVIENKSLAEYKLAEIKREKEEIINENNDDNKEKFHVNLPKLQFKKFAGKIEDYEEFMDMYTTVIHENQSLTKTQKFLYLKNYLIGEAKCLLDGLSITNENYDAAMDILKNKYGNKDVLISYHVIKLINLKKVNEEDSDSLESLYNNIIKHIRQLESLGVTPDMYSVFLVPIILSKLTAKIIQEWLRTRREGIHKLMSFIHKELSAKKYSNQLLLSFRKESDNHNKVNNINNTHKIDVLRKSKIKTTGEKSIHDKSSDAFHVAKLDKSIKGKYPLMDEIPHTLKVNETMNSSCTEHETNMKNVAKIIRYDKILKIRNPAEQEMFNKPPESLKSPSNVELRGYFAETYQTNEKNVVGSNQMIVEQEEDLNVSSEITINELYKISQSEEEEIVNINGEILDRFTCNCDGCMFYDCPSITELKEDCLDWTKTWLEICEKSISDPWNLSYNNINVIKGIENMTSRTKKKKCIEVKRSRTTKQSPKFNVLQRVQNVQAEAKYKMQDKSLEKSRKYEVPKLRYKTSKNVNDSVMSSQKIIRKTKKKKISNSSTYHSVSRHKTDKKLENIITIKKKTVKLSINERNLSKYKYRRKKKVKNRHKSMVGIFHVKNRSIKQYKTKRLSRSTRKVKFKEIIKRQFNKKSYKISVMEYRSKKPWKEKIKFKLKWKIIGKKECDIVIIKSGGVETHGAWKVQQSKFKIAKLLKMGCFSVGLKAINIIGSNKQYQKSCLTSLNAGECQILRSSIE